MSQQQQRHPVVVTDIQMRFDSMVWFMVKWAFASIPAVLLIVIIAAVAIAALAAFTGGLNHWLAGRTQPAPGAQVTQTAHLAQPTQTPAPAPGFTVLRKGDFGDAWPLTADSARIWCEPGNALLLVSGGTIYAVNQAARDAFPQHRPLDDIWIAGADATPLVAAGMRLCR